MIDYEVADFVDRAKLPARSDTERAPRRRQFAGADGEIAAHKLVLQGKQVDAISCDPIRLEQNSHFPGVDSPQVDFRDTVDTFKPPLDLSIEHLVAFGQVALC